MTLYQYLKGDRDFGNFDFAAQSTGNHILEIETYIKGIVSNNDTVGQEVSIHMLLTKDIFAQHSIEVLLSTTMVRVSKVQNSIHRL